MIQRSQIAESWHGENCPGESPGFESASADFEEEINFLNEATAEWRP